MIGPPVVGVAAGLRVDFLVFFAAGFLAVFFAALPADLRAGLLALDLPRLTAFFAVFFAPARFVAVTDFLVFLAFDFLPFLARAAFAISILLEASNAI